MIVDAHQHFWNPGRNPSAWLSAFPALDRVYEHDDLAAELTAAGVDCTVLVQAEDQNGETDYLFEIAARHAHHAGVVGWIPLDRPAAAEARLAELLARPKFAGIRALIHLYDDPDWLLGERVGDGLALLAAAGVPFDVVSVLPRHLEHVPTLSDRHPDLRMVIDHLSKPPIGSADWEPWRTLIARAAANPLVYAKLSGLYSTTGADQAAVDLRPYVDYALDLFGPERLMVGSDWPVAVTAGGYAPVWGQLVDALAHLGRSERDAVLGGTAVRFYGLSPEEES